MRKRYNGYVYSNPMSKEASPFDSGKFQQYINEHNYDDAVAYMSNYIFDDPQKRAEWNHYKETIRREGARRNAIYGTVSENTDQWNAMQFLERRNEDGWIRINRDKNPYAAKEYKARKELGFYKDIDDPNATATTALEFEFQPTVRKGIFGWDWTARDGLGNLESFLSHANIDEAEFRQDLQNNLIFKDGRAVVTAKPGDKYFDALLEFVTNGNRKWYEASKGHGDYVKVSAVNGNNKIATNLVGNSRALVNDNTSLNPFNDRFVLNEDSSEVSRNALRDYYNNIRVANDVQESVIKNAGIQNKTYSGTLIGNLSDDWERLTNAFNAGEIDLTTYNALIKENCNTELSLIKSIGSGNYKMLSNGFNKEVTDETMVDIDNKHRSDIAAYISSADPKDMHLMGAVYNGQVGTFISIDAQQVPNKSLSRNDTPDDMLKSRRVQVFIPGLFTEQIQQRIDNDSEVQAILQRNDMLDYGMSYKTYDGKKLKCINGKDGIDENTGQTYSEQDMLNLINEDLIIRKTIENLPEQYLNEDGNFINENAVRDFRKMARQMSIKAVNDIFKNDALLNSDLTPMKLANADRTVNESLFDYMGAGGTLADKYRKQFTQGTANKLNHMYYIYNSIIDVLNLYGVYKAE